MRKFVGLITILGFVYSIAAVAAIPDKEEYDPYFTVDLEEELPTYEELQEHFADQFTVYDRKYDFHWNIGNLFDAVFRTTISQYGGTEKRVKDANEESLMIALSLLPPEYYQYIGPYLHTVPTISEKILNMPGIKETKNKFPTRIAPQLADIEDLEFLSPYLYFLLMPEVWPDNQTPLEYPRRVEKSTKSVRNDKLYDLIRKIVPADEFYPDAPTQTQMSLKDLRTIDITVDSPLTSGDIKAFVRTIPELNKLQDDFQVMARIYGAGSLLDMWEIEQGKGLFMNSFKDLIYPCRRLVQKMQIAGEEKYLQRIVAKEGFTPKEWAYTCDKTIRAYRMITLSHSTVVSLKMFATGAYDNEMREAIGDEKMKIIDVNTQGMLRMHGAPRDDILEVYKNRQLLSDSFQNAKYSIIAAPIAISN